MVRYANTFLWLRLPLGKFFFQTNIKRVTFSTGETKQRRRFISSLKTRMSEEEWNRSSAACESLSLVKPSLSLSHVHPAPSLFRPLRSILSCLSLSVVSSSRGPFLEKCRCQSVLVDVRADAQSANTSRGPYTSVHSSQSFWSIANALERPPLFLCGRGEGRLLICPRVFLSKGRVPCM